ncbi:MAG: FkbM family methyltransferase [Alphaproteobacteria bacterium]|nr:FkbM family methyltransferase [Alphaproteobacteria bacterium]
MILRYIMSRRIPIARRWLPALAKGWAAITWKGGFKVVRAAGALFLVDYRNLVDRHVGLIGGYDHAQLRWLADHVDRHGCDVFFDIGANLGYYAVLLARHQKVARVVAFEPDIRNFHHLCGNLYLNRLSREVSPQPFAVGNVNGPLQFTLREDASSGGSHIAKSGERDTVEVHSVRLDDFLPASGQTLFFKIDVEGHELEALEGMSDLLANNRCLVQVESFGAKIAEVTHFLESASYTFRKSIGPDHFFDNFEG